MRTLTDYIRPGDGPDRTPALNRAVAAALPLAEQVLIPAGQYRFLTRPQPIGSGVTLIGEGMNSSSTGTYLVADYPETDPEAGFLTWDGSGPLYRGAGGGIRDCTVYRSLRHAGGTGIGLVGISDSQRPGFWRLDNVLIGGKGEAGPAVGLWDYGLLVDGMRNTSPGASGIRNVYLYGLLACRAHTAAELRNVAHLFWMGGEVFEIG